MKSTVCSRSDKRIVFDCVAVVLPLNYLPVEWTGRDSNPRPTAWDNQRLATRPDYSLGEGEAGVKHSFSDFLGSRVKWNPLQ